jgi:hypothetical protein
MAILLFVHLTRHSSTASEQLSFISLVPEIGTPGLMSGDGKRSVVHDTAVQMIDTSIVRVPQHGSASLGTEDSQWAGHEAV